MLRRILAATACAAAAIAIAPSGAAAQGFAPAADLADPRAASTWRCSDDHECYLPGVYEMDIAANAAGDAVATWLQLHEEGDSFQVRAAYRPAGGAFGAPQTLGDYSWNPYETGGPDAGIDDAGRALVVWRDHSNSGSIYDRTLLAEAPAGGVFGEATMLDDRTATDPVAAVTPSGHAVIAWERSGPDGVTQAVTREPNGAFGAPVTVAGPRAGSTLDLEAGDDGSAVLAWVQPGDERRVFASVRVAAGEFSEPQALATGNFWGLDTAVAPGGRAAVVWEAGALVNSPRSIEARFLTPAGAPEGPPEPLSQTGNGNDPEIAFDGAGSAVAVWGECEAPNGVGTCSTVAADRPADGAFGAPQTIEGQAGAGGGVELVTGPGGHVAGVTATPGTGDVAVTRKLAGETFGAFTPVPRPGGEAVGPGIALDAAGNPIVAWTIKNPEGLERAQAAIGDWTAPELSAEVPATAERGQAVTMTASASDPSGATIDWDFGDGATARGAEVGHAYATAGRYGVTVTATDAMGNARSVTRTIAVAAPAPAPPTPTPGGSSGGQGGPPSPPPPGPIVVPRRPSTGARVAARFTRRGRRTEIRRLAVTHMAAGAAVEVRCRARKGCPFAVRRWASTPSGWRNARRALGKRTTLRAGTVIELRITAPGMEGQVVRYTLRGKRRPRVALGCLPAGASAGSGPQLRC